MRRRMNELEKVAGFSAFLAKMREYDVVKDELKCARTSILDDFQEINEYLIKYGYIRNENGEIIVLKKGVIASNISECNPIFLTELICCDFFEKMSDIDIVKILTVFLNENEGDSCYSYDEKITDYVNEMKDIIQDFWKDDKTYLNWNINLQYIDLIDLWINENVFDNSEMHEGNFIRDMIRLNNIIQNISGLLAILEKNELRIRFEQLGKLIMKGFVSIDSLYIKLN
jgi:superfamily II RNA helicase